MVNISDDLVKKAVETKTIDADYNEESLSSLVEELLSERIKKNRRLGLLQYRGSKIWEGNLDEMRECY